MPRKTWRTTVAGTTFSVACGCSAQSWMTCWRTETAARRSRHQLVADAAQRHVAERDVIGVERGALDHVARADEARDEFRARAVIDVLRRAGLLDLAVVHHRDHVGGGHRLRLVVRDVDGGVAILVVQPPHLEAHFLAQVGVEIGQRLVEQQRLWLDDQRARQRDALLLAAREFARIAVGELAQLRGAEDRRDLALDRRAVDFAQFEAVGDVLRHRHVRPQRVALEDHRHVAPLGRHGAGRRGDDLAADADFARGRLDETGDQPQRGGLAAARRAQQAHQATVLDGQRYVVDDRERAVVLRQTPQFDRRHAVPPCRAMHCRAAFCLLKHQSAARHPRQLAAVLCATLPTAVSVTVPGLQRTSAAKRLRRCAAPGTPYFTFR